MFEIPIDSTEAHSRRSISLDGSAYLLDLDWSERTASWYCSLYLQTASVPVPIFEGLRVGIDYPLLTGNTAPDRPPGELVPAGPLTIDGPGRDDMGTRVRLVYWPAAELGRG